jgi:hypothetical protein
MSSTRDIARSSDRDCHTSSILNFVIGGLVLAGLVIAGIVFLR